LVQPINSRPLSEQFKGLVRLTRWKEYVPFVIPLTILGALLAARPHGILLDWRLVAVIAANILAVSYAFMINDIEDALVPAERARRNPITLGMVNIRTGYAVCRIIAAVTLILYAIGGLSPFLIGLLTLFISHMYSWRPVRLKAHPVTDIVSHSLMLSGLLLLAGYFLYHNDPGVVWFVAGGATLFSVYGQLYNQLREFETDKSAGLQNTAIWLGEQATRRIMHISAALAIACLAVAIFRDVFPVAFLVAVPVGFMLMALLRTSGSHIKQAVELEDARRLRRRVSRLNGWLLINIIVTAWLVYTIGDQMQILEQISFDFWGS